MFIPPDVPHQPINLSETDAAGILKGPGRTQHASQHNPFSKKGCLIYVCVGGL